MCLTSSRKILSGKPNQLIEYAFQAIDIYTISPNHREEKAGRRANTWLVLFKILNLKKNFYF